MCRARSTDVGAAGRAGSSRCCSRIRCPFWAFWADCCKGLAAHVVTVPHTTEVLGPLLTVIPMQQLAFHIGVLRRNNVDKPRHLEKVVSDHNLCGVSLP